MKLFSLNLFNFGTIDILTKIIHLILPNLFPLILLSKQEIFYHSKSYSFLFLHFLSFQIQKFKTNKQRNIKISNYSKVLKLFPKISRFFPDLRFGMFALSNNEQRQRVQKGKEFLRWQRTKLKPGQTGSKFYSLLVTVNKAMTLFDQA